MDTPEITRRPFSARDLPAALDFIAEHPAGEWEPPLLKRLLVGLPSGPEAVIVLDVAGATALVASVIDTVKNAFDAAPFELFGYRPGPDGERALSLALSLAEEIARRAGYARLEATTGGRLLMPPALLTRHGFREAFGDYLMRRPEGLAPPAPPPPLPPGCFWADAEERHAEEYMSLLHLAFHGVPSFQMTSLEQLRAALANRRIPLRLLFDGPRLVGSARVELSERDPGEGEVASLARHPEYRGRGVGERLLYEALARLSERGATRFRLSVTASNRRALALYERFGFAIAERYRSYHRDI
jgi:ribosomal protein S18 acetylase RimI-like enzyme